MLTQSLMRNRSTLAISSLDDCYSLRSLKHCPHWVTVLIGRPLMMVTALIGRPLIRYKGFEESIKFKIFLNFILPPPPARPHLLGVRQGECHFGREPKMTFFNDFSLKNTKF